MELEAIHDLTVSIRDGTILCDDIANLTLSARFGTMGIDGLIDGISDHHFARISAILASCVAWASPPSEETIFVYYHSEVESVVIFDPIGSDRSESLDGDQENDVPMTDLGSSDEESPPSSLRQTKTLDNGDAITGAPQISHRINSFVFISNYIAASQTPGSSVPAPAHASQKMGQTRLQDAHVTPFPLHIPQEMLVESPHGRLDLSVRLARTEFITSDQLDSVVDPERVCAVHRTIYEYASVKEPDARWRFILERIWEAPNRQELESSMSLKQPRFSVSCECVDLAAHLAIYPDVTYISKSIFLKMRDLADAQTIFCPIK